jgi:hypothetical protein
MKADRMERALIALLLVWMKTTIVHPNTARSSQYGSKKDVANRLSISKTMFFLLGVCENLSAAIKQSNGSPTFT